MRRDPARIDEVLDALREAWKANPDYRLTQLVANAVRHAVPGIGPTAVAHYNTEDGPVLVGLRSMAETRPASPLLCPDVAWKWRKWTVGFWTDPANRTRFGIDLGPLEVVWRTAGYRP